MLWCNSKSVVLTFNIFIFPPAAGSAVFLCAGCTFFGAAAARFWDVSVVGGGRVVFFYAQDAAAEVEERSAGGGGAVFGVGDGWSALGCLARGCVGAGAGAGGVWGC